MTKVNATRRVVYSDSPELTSNEKLLSIAGTGRHGANTLDENIKTSKRSRNGRQGDGVDGERLDVPRLCLYHRICDCQSDSRLRLWLFFRQP